MLDRIFQIALPALGVAGAVLWLQGCGTTAASEAELARVAKDWAMSVRASQVIPVYPLTEDVQPGDVFITSLPVDEAAREYREKGFLSFSDHVLRLDIPASDYLKFYGERYGVSAATPPPPSMWQRAAAPAAGVPWDAAPISAFPTYSFRVSRQAGLNVAVPVQGIPVGLNVLGTADAFGMIAIARSYTYGIDSFTLENKLADWANRNSAFLSQFAPPPGLDDAERVRRTRFLRVVERVYLATQVDIAMFSEDSFGGKVDAGIPRPVELLNPTTNPNEKPFDRTQQNLQELNRIIKEESAEADKAAQAVASGAAASPMAVGGTLRFGMASARSVSMKETFRRPLVIGYIGFDIPIVEGGKLGGRVATKAMLEGKAVISGPVVRYGADNTSEDIRNAIKADPSLRDRITAWLEKNYPDASKRPGIPEFLNGAEFSAARARVIQEVVNAH